MDQLTLLISFILGGAGLIGVLYYFFYTIRFGSQCPRCGDRHPNRVARKGILKYTPTKAFYCCGKRFYQLSLRKDYQPQRTQLM